MKFTQEELHELNQMMDRQIATLYRNQIEYFKSLRDVEPSMVTKAVSQFIDDSVKNRNLIETIRIKVNQKK